MNTPVYLQEGTAQEQNETEKSACKCKHTISLALKKQPPSGKVQSKFNKFCTLSFLTMKSQRLSNFFAFCLEEGKRQIFMFSLSVFLSHKKPPKLCGQKLEVSSRQLLTWDLEESFYLKKENNKKVQSITNRNKVNIRLHCTSAQRDIFGKLE